MYLNAEISGIVPGADLCVYRNQHLAADLASSNQSFVRVKRSPGAGGRYCSACYVYCPVTSCCTEKPLKRKSTVKVCFLYRPTTSTSREQHRQVRQPSWAMNAMTNGQLMYGVSGTSDADMDRMAL